MKSGSNSPPFAQIAQNLQQAAEVDGVFRQAAAPIQPHGDCIRGPLRKLVISVQRPKRVDKRGAIEHMMCPDDAGRQDPHAKPAQATDQILGQHGQSLLKAVVPSEADFQLVKRLMMAVVTRDQVRANFVLQQCIDASPRDARAAANKSWSPETMRPAYMSSRTETVAEKSAHRC